MKTTSTSTTSQLNRTVRWFALAVWVLFVLTHVLIFVVDSVFDFADMQLPCMGALGASGACNMLAISPAEVAVLSSWGLNHAGLCLGYARATGHSAAGVLAAGWSDPVATGHELVWAGSFSSLDHYIPIATVSGVPDGLKIFPAMFIFLNAVAVLGSVITLVFFLYLLPNGRLSPQWAYIPLVFTVLLYIVFQLGFENNLIGLPPQAHSLLITILMILLFLGGGLQIYRYRRVSNAIERQQTKWVLFGILAEISAVFVWFLIFSPALTIPAGQPQLMAYLGGWFFINSFLLLILPVSITIAILRYKLWGIDVITRKTFVYLLLSGLLALVYFGTVILLQNVFGAFISEQSPVVIVNAHTGHCCPVCAIARARAGVHRPPLLPQEVHREAGTCTVCRHGARRDGHERLTAELARVVQETVAPDGVSVWLRKM